jgi:hypothetical protein
VHAGYDLTPTIHRFDFLYALLPFFLAQILLRTLKISTTLFLNSFATSRRSKRLMISSCGGTGMCIHDAVVSLYDVCLSFSQVFPAYSSAKRTVSKNSALARIRERRAALRDASNTDA